MWGCRHLRISGGYPQHSGYSDHNLVLDGHNHTDHDQEQSEQREKPAESHLNAILVFDANQTNQSSQHALSDLDVEQLSCCAACKTFKVLNTNLVVHFWTGKLKAAITQDCTVHQSDEEEL